MTANLLVLALAIGAPQLRDPQPAPTLLGRWSATRIVTGGKDFTSGNTDMEYEFTADGRFVVYREGKVMEEKPRNYTLDAKAGPGAIDLIRATEMTQLAFFKVEKDTLNIAIRVGKGGRPTDFDGTSDTVMVVVLARVKK